MKRKVRDVPVRERIEAAVELGLVDAGHVAVCFGALQKVGLVSADSKIAAAVAQLPWVAPERFAHGGGGNFKSKSEALVIPPDMIEWVREQKGDPTWPIAS